MTAANVQGALDKQAQQLSKESEQLARQRNIRCTLELHLKDLYHDYKRLQQELAGQCQTCHDLHRTLARNDAALTKAWSNQAELRDQAKALDKQLCDAKVCMPPLAQWYA